MTRLKYNEPTTASWTEMFYHDSVEVVDGITETDDPLTVEALLYKGFSIIEEGVPSETTTTKRSGAAKSPAK